MSYEPEKRQYPRLLTSYIVRYKLRGDQIDYDTCQTQNISQGGMLLLTSKPFNHGNQLELYIQFPFTEEKAIVIAEVVSCKELQKNLSYEIRLKFIEMDDTIKQKLGEIINRRREMGQK